MSHKRSSKSSKRGGAKKKSGKKKRPMNAYMKALLKAKKEKAASFVYVDKEGKKKTYKRDDSGPMVIYKAA